MQPLRNTARVIAGITALAGILAACGPPPSTSDDAAGLTPEAPTSTHIARVCRDASDPQLVRRIGHAHTINAESRALAVRHLARMRSAIAMLSTREDIPPAEAMWRLMIPGFGSARYDALHARIRAEVEEHRPASPDFVATALVAARLWHDDPMSARVPNPWPPLTELICRGVDVRRALGRDGQTVDYVLRAGREQQTLAVVTRDDVVRHWARHHFPNGMAPDDQRLFAYAARFGDRPEPPEVDAAARAALAEHQRRMQRFLAVFTRARRLTVRQAFSSTWLYTASTADGRLLRRLLHDVGGYGADAEIRARLVIAAERFWHRHRWLRAFENPWTPLVEQLARGYGVRFEVDAHRDEAVSTLVGRDGVEASVVLGR